MISFVNFVYSNRDVEILKNSAVSRVATLTFSTLLST